MPKRKKIPLRIIGLDPRLQHVNGLPGWVRLPLPLGGIGTYFLVLEISRDHLWATLAVLAYAAAWAKIGDAIRRKRECEIYDQIQEEKRLGTYVDPWPDLKKSPQPEEKVD